MCGIAGFLNYSLDRNVIDQIQNIQKHRGPDYQGEFNHKDLTLLHQRLSIIDLDERANQPFIKGGLAIIFNGEIYNYKEIKAKLITQYNIEFQTSSDTEVLLELYRYEKENCLLELRGMFSFCIYNIEKETLFLARDHFGIKPLFYSLNGSKFAFASELKTLLKLPGYAVSLNFEQLIAGINYLWIPGNESVVKGIKKLPPGYYLNIDKTGNLELTQYYNPSIKLLQDSEESFIDKLDSVFDESMNYHMVSDVPVSAFLSGGLDSSLICAKAYKISNKLSTYTIGTSGKDKKVEQMPADEKYALRLANSMGFDHHEIKINADIVNDLPFISAMLDEPIGDPAAINTYLICKAARAAGVKVLLSGMGADELFFGYRRQLATLKAMQFQKLPKCFRNSVKSFTNILPVKIFGKGFKTGRWAKRFMNFANLPPSDAYRMSYSYYSKKQLSSLLLKDYKYEIEELDRKHSNLFNSGNETDIINKMCKTDISYFMNGLNLTYTDRASMAASVEVRVPFIDKEVVSLAMQIPGKFKYKNNQQKYILKKMAENYLPNNIIYRPKASFGAPIRSWISSDLKEMVGDLLNEDTVKRRGIFNPKDVKNLIEKDRSGKADNAYQIYYLLTLENWMREYLDKK